MKRKTEEGEEQEEEEETPKKKKIGWEVGLMLLRENEPPKKVLKKGEETLDEWEVKAEILNKLEKIETALLS